MLQVNTKKAFICIYKSAVLPQSSDCSRQQNCDLCLRNRRQSNLTRIIIIGCYDLFERFSRFKLNFTLLYPVKFFHGCTFGGLSEASYYLFSFLLSIVQSFWGSFLLFPGNEASTKESDGGRRLCRRPVSAAYSISQLVSSRQNKSGPNLRRQSRGVATK